MTYDYLIYSKTGISLFLVPHLVQSKDVGTVFFVCPDTAQKDLGQDMDMFRGWGKMRREQDLWKVINEHEKDSLIIVIDDVGVGSLADHLRSMGYKVIGGSQLMDRFENERDFGTKLMGKIMHVPPTKAFKNFQEGVVFLKSQEKDARFVFKPDDCDVPKEYTYVAKDVADMVEMIGELKGKWKWEESFQLQTFIQGTETDVSRWFDGENYLPNTTTYYFENKKVLTGDLGVAGGGEVAVQFVRDDEGEYDEIFKKLLPFMRKTGYIGQISINTMVSEEDKHPYFLEVTARFGYPSFPMDITMLEEKGHTMHDFFLNLLEKKKKEMYPKNVIATVLVVTSPPYPHGEIDGKAKGLPITWEKDWDRYVYPYGIKYDKDSGKTVFSDGTGMGLNVTCVDKTLKGAVSMTYETYVPSIHVKNMQYRIDLGDSAEKRIKELKSMGILK